MGFKQVSIDVYYDGERHDTRPVVEDMIDNKMLMITRDVENYLGLKEESFTHICSVSVDLHKTTYKFLLLKSYFSLNEELVIVRKTPVGKFRS